MPCGLKKYTDFFQHGNWWVIHGKGFIQRKVKILSTLESGKVKIPARLNTKRVKRHNFWSGTEKKVE